MGSLPQEHCHPLGTWVGWNSRRQIRCIGVSFPPQPRLSLTWQRLCRAPNPANCNSHRSHSCPFSPAVTACHMVCCSSPSWEGCDCSREPPRSAERVPQPARSGPGGAPARSVRLGWARLGFARQRPHGRAVFAAAPCHICSSQSHIACPGFVPGTSGLWPRVWSEVGRSLPRSPRPGTPGCRAGMLRVSQGMRRPLVLAARKAARGDGTCLWEMQKGGRKC